MPGETARCGSVSPLTAALVILGSRKPLREIPRLRPKHKHKQHMGEMSYGYGSVNQESLGRHAEADWPTMRSVGEPSDLPLDKFERDIVGRMQIGNPDACIGTASFVDVGRRNRPSTKRSQMGYDCVDILNVECDMSKSDITGPRIDASSIRGALYAISSTV